MFCEARTRHYPTIALRRYDGRINFHPSERLPGSNPRVLHFLVAAKRFENQLKAGGKRR